MPGLPWTITSSEPLLMLGWRPATTETSSPNLGHRGWRASALFMMIGPLPAPTFSGKSTLPLLGGRELDCLMTGQLCGTPPLSKPCSCICRSVVLIVIPRSRAFLGGNLVIVGFRRSTLPLGLLFGREITCLNFSNFADSLALSKLLKLQTASILARCSVLP